MTVSSLATPLPRTRRLARLARQAFAWWWAELCGLVPRVLIGALHHRGSAALLEISAAEATLVAPQEGRTGPVRIPVALDSSASALDGTRFRLRRFGQLVVRIRLAQDLVFRTTVDLPLAAERSLEAIVRHQLERLVPLDPATLVFASRIIERVPLRNVLRVEVAIIKQATLKRAHALALALGLTVASIDDAGTEQALVFWRSSSVTRTTPWGRRLRRGLEAAAILFLAAAYFLHVQHLDQQRALLQEQVAEVARRADLVRALDARTRMTEQSLAIFERRRADPTVLSIIEELTRQVPTDSWVSEFRLHDGTVELIGTAPRATDLIAHIASSAKFADATFRSPTTLAASGTGERFDIGFRVRRDAAAP